MKGSVVRQRLSQVGMTQAELARLLKVSPQTVNNILHTENIQTGTLERICEALHLPITFFYDEPKNDAAPDVYTDAKLEVDVDNVAKFWKTNRIGDKVKSLLRSQHKTMTALSQYVGMTDPGLRRAFNRNSCNINVLLKIAEFFNVPLNYFLPEDKRAEEESEKDREIEFLKGQVKAYETAFAAVLNGIMGGEGSQPSPLRTANE